MNNNFSEKLSIYKKGQLSEEESADIEREIEKYMAIHDYLTDEEKEFIDELKIPTPNGSDSKVNMSLKRKINLRIIIFTLISVIASSFVLVSVFFLLSRATTSLFALDYKESFVERHTITQLTEIFYPQYNTNGSGNSSNLFGKQNFEVTLVDTLGHSQLDETTINVDFKFGKPVRSETYDDSDRIPPDFLYTEYFNPDNHEANTGFDILEKAPSGTKAKILIEFNTPIFAEDLKKNFINPLNDKDLIPDDITPLAALGKFVIANPSFFQYTPMYPFEDNRDEYNKFIENNNGKHDKFDAMDNQAHTQSFIGNLNLIKDNMDLLKAMYYENMLDDMDLDGIIKDVEVNGVKYMGVYISADTKELLKLQENPLIHCMWVQNIVLW